MTFKKLILAFFALLSVFCCTKDEIQEITKKTPPTFNYTIPSSYSFQRNGKSSVDFAGQTTRILMVEEMSGYVKNQTKNNLEVDKVKLKAMFINTASPFANADLNTPGRQIRDKVAASKDYFNLYLGGATGDEQDKERIFIENTFAQIDTASLGKVASAGIPGKYGTGDSTKYFYLDGIEPLEVFLKGIIGSLFLDQVANNFLSVYKLDEDKNRENNTNKVLEPTTNFTKMENTWDQAYGYVFGATGNKLLAEQIIKANKYLPFNTIKEDITLAFIRGRAAIVANDYVARNEQINIIKQKLALVIAIQSISYLQEGKSKLGSDNGAAAFHDLSQAFGLIKALRYTNKPGKDTPYFTKAEVRTMTLSLTNGINGNGFWNSAIGAKTDTISSKIAKRFGIEEVLIN